MRPVRARCAFAARRLTLLAIVVCAGCGSSPIPSAQLSGGASPDPDANPDPDPDPGGQTDPDPLSAIVVADRYQLATASDAGAYATLRAVAIGGTPPFTYTWSALSPGGEPADHLLSSDEVGSCRFAPDEQPGPYVIRGSISDSAGQTQSCMATIQVGSSLGLASVATRAGVVVGGGTDGESLIQLNPQGGTPPYTVTWSVLSPDGQSEPERLDTSDPLAPVFISGDTSGTYVLTATVEDAAGNSMVESFTVVVGQNLGLDVIADRSRVLPDGGVAGMARLQAVPIGGRNPYTYEWEVLGEDGETQNHLLWDTSVASPVFESNEESGYYVVRCAVTDGEGTVLIGSEQIRVGQDLALDVVADRVTLALTADSEQRVQIRAASVGGRPPLQYTWEVTDPEGDDASDLLNTTSRSVVTFSSPQIPGSYVVRCTATDADGMVAGDAVTLTVGNTLGLTLTGDRVMLTSSGDATYRRSNLTAHVYGGREPYSYLWTAYQPDGEQNDQLLDNRAFPAPVFIGGDLVGDYIVLCTVTDANGAVAHGAMSLHVGLPLSVDASTDRQALVGGGGVGGQAQLLATVRGGAKPYTYQWSVTAPDGADAVARLNSPVLNRPVFTSAFQPGTFSITLTVTDARGLRVSDSIELVVGSTGGGAAGQDLSLDVTTDDQTLSTGGGATGMASVQAFANGGVAPIEFLWAVTAPDGTSDDGRLDATTNSSATFTSAAAQGTYRIRCTVSDAVGNIFTDSLQIEVADEFLLDIRAAAARVGPGDAITLYADRTGGVPNFTYNWTCLDEADASRGGFAADPQSGAGDLTNTWTAPADLGTYRIICTATDTDGNSFTDSVLIEVSDRFLLDITADLVAAAPGQVVNLTANRTGGTANFDYDWTCTDESGADCAGFGTDPQTAGDDVTNTWTAPADLGTFRITCLATDADGATFTDSLHLRVTNTFLLDVRTSKAFAAPGAVVNLTADRTGGLANFTYDWSCLDGAGNACGGFGADPQTAADDVANTWTAPAALDTYRLICTATDAEGQTFTDSTSVVVADSFLLDVSANATHVTPGGSVTLTADQSGGSTPYQYVWNAYNAAGINAGTFTGGPPGAGVLIQAVQVADASATWTAPTTMGTYRIICLATDADANTFTDSVMVVVADTFYLDLAAKRTHVPPGQQAGLVLERTGGTDNLAYEWYCRDEADALSGTFTTGSLGADSGRATQNDNGDPVANSWTAPAAAAGVFGTYHITVVGTDANGLTFTDSVEVVVDEAFSLDLQAEKVRVAPGGTVDLLANRTGGEPDFDYAWQALDSADALTGTFAVGPAGAGTADQSSQADDVTNTWTAPATAAGVDDTYRIICEATDGMGRTFEDAVNVVVGSADTLCLDVTTKQTVVAPGATVNLVGRKTGGSGPYDYAWIATDAGDNSVGGFGAASQLDVAGDTTNTWTAPVALGTYRIECELSDELGDLVWDTVHVLVDAPLTLNVTARTVFVAPSTAISLTADQTGGEANYDYVWSATNSSGAAAGTFTVGSTGVGIAQQLAQGGDANNTWSVATGDTYTVSCIAGDNSGQIFTDSVQVVVTALEMFSLDITGDVQVLWPGDVLNLAGDRTGGTPNFSYAWSALDESGAAAGTLGSATQAGEANDVTNTWTAPTGSGAEGSYRIRCTLTDALANAFTDTLMVRVSSLAIQNVFLQPDASDDDSVLPLMNVSFTALFGAPGQEILPVNGLVSPVHPRNVVVTLVDWNGDNSISGGTAQIIGRNARGESVSELIAIAPAAGGQSVSTGGVPFAVVEKVNLYDLTGVAVLPPGAADRVKIGVGDKFGLTGLLDAAEDVRYVSEDGTVLTSGYSVDAASGRQGITFSSAPDGARTYVVVFRARN